MGLPGDGDLAAAVADLALRARGSGAAPGGPATIGSLPSVIEADRLPVSAGRRHRSPARSLRHERPDAGTPRAGASRRRARARAGTAAHGPHRGAGRDRPRGPECGHGRDGGGRPCRRALGTARSGCGSGRGARARRRPPAPSDDADPAAKVAALAPGDRSAATAQRRVLLVDDAERVDDPDGVLSRIATAGTQAAATWSSPRPRSGCAPATGTGWPSCARAARACCSGPAHSTATCSARCFPPARHSQRCQAGHCSSPTGPPQRPR